MVTCNTKEPSNQSNNPMISGQREMACMINEDIIDEMQKAGSGLGAQVINNNYSILDRTSANVSKTS